MANQRGRFNSNLGFVLAAAGSAIGLGNIWRFPYSVGEGGGGAFVLIYLAFVLGVGLPVLLTELSIGRQTGRNPVGALRQLAPGSPWRLAGGLGVVTGFAILAFYSVVAGWMLGYLGMALGGGLRTAVDAESSEYIFESLVTNPWIGILLAGAFIVLTIVVVQGGVSKGIERVSKILMPLLFVLLIGLAIRSMFLEGAGKGLAYLFKPDFGKVNFPVVMQALGQALFSLSLGMGAMITYGSYVSRTENLWKAGITVALFDTMIAILAGLVIFPALFFAGQDPAGGPGLVFMVLPTIFNTMPAGNFVAILFFFLMTIAALTSTICLLEVVVAYFVDEKGWARRTASMVLGAACFALAVPSALATDAVSWLSEDGLFSWSFLDLNNNIWGNYSLSIGAILICLFAGWQWGIPKLLASLSAGRDGGFPLPAPGLFGLLVKIICPLAIFAALLFIVLTGEYF